MLKVIPVSTDLKVSYEHDRGIPMLTIEYLPATRANP